jgi:hypothetical protein
MQTYRHTDILKSECPLTVMESKVTLESTFENACLAELIALERAHVAYALSVSVAVIPY